MKPSISRLIVALCALGPSFLHADVKMPALFGDHMVLQQGAKLPIWGTADSGEKIKVTVGDKSAETTTGADGKWRVDLAPLAVTAKPVTLTITDRNTLTFTDVLVGEVWLCSGQSNMEYPLGAPGVMPKQLTGETDDQLRLFHVTKKYGIVPADDVEGSWELSSFKTGHDFSAVGYYFGKNIRNALHCPVGLIESAKGGSAGESWTSLSALEANPVLQHYAEDYKTLAAVCPNTNAEFLAKVEAETAAQRTWAATLHTDPAYQASLKSWKDAMAQAQAAGQHPPPQPPPPTPEPVPTIKMGHAPTLLFNSMLHPLLPYAIKGVIWYQGEANTGKPGMALEYRTLLPAMIADWRARWGEGDFPFLIVQLANFGVSPKTGEEESNWAVVRESQLKTLAVPKTGLTVTIDIGDGTNVHCADKADVGARLALAARHVAYGEKLVYTGPIYDSCQVDADKIRITFQGDSIGGGLVIGSSPWKDPKATPVSTTELQGFAIAGEDKKWVRADAKVEGNLVIVSSAQVPKPVAVRYGWAGNPTCNLYNKEGLPASPFRTDDWEPGTPIVVPTQ